MRVRPIALISVLCVALAGHLAFAADDVVDKLLKRQACDTNWQLCLQNCSGDQSCISTCTTQYVICTLDTTTPQPPGQPEQPGERPPVEIRTGAGLCLDVHAPQIAANGGRVQAWACNGRPQQRWTYHPAERALRVASRLCLDVHAPQMAANGGRVQVWTCNGAPQQQWTRLKNGALRNAGGLCLDVHAADQTRNGARVQVWQCNGAPQQRFRFVAVPAGPGPSAVRPAQRPPATTN